MQRFIYTATASLQKPFITINSRAFQSQIQDLPKEGARFRVKCHDSVGGGGGGGSSRIFP